MRQVALVMLLAVGVGTGVYAQTSAVPIVVSGICEATSGVSINGGENNRFSCNAAVISRTERGTILIQFADKGGDDGRILGFGGTIEGKQGFGADAVQMMAVERLYLASGAQPISVSRGTCIMNWSGLQRTGGQLTSVLCGARGTAEGADIKAIVALKVP